MTHYTPFQALAPLSWTDDIAAIQDDPPALAVLLDSTFSRARLLLESIPAPYPEASTSVSSKPGRPRSHTDSAVSFISDPGPSQPGDSSHHHQTAADTETITKLRKEWKDLKMRPAQPPSQLGKPVDDKTSGPNPHGIAMYKMGGKDGKGAWFARRSLHFPPTSRQGENGSGNGNKSGAWFDKWEAALRREMQVTLERAAASPGKVPGTGNVRGIGAERRVDGVEVEVGRMDVYHVSARFPGPTTPRDFITVIMMPTEKDNQTQSSKRPRTFMLISRPCDHPDCPPRSGFIRGTYESVEMIREVPIDKPKPKPLRRARSSVDVSGTNKDEIEKALAAGSGERVSREAVLRAAKQAVGDEVESEGEARTKSFRPESTGDDEDDDDDTEMAVEWMMVTRSDPGGSVPRFMVEKGTPGGIIGDAGKFLKWFTSQGIEDSKRPVHQQEVPPAESQTEKEKPQTGEESELQPPKDISATDGPPDSQSDDQLPTSNSGIYGMLSSALSMATSAVASSVAAFAPASLETDTDVSDFDDETDVSDDEEDEHASQPGQPSPRNTDTDKLMPGQAKSEQDKSAADDDNQSTRSTLSETPSQALSPAVARAQAQHEKELAKLQQRMRKAEEKIAREQAKRRAKNAKANGSGKDAGKAENEMEKESIKENGNGAADSTDANSIKTKDSKDSKNTKSSKDPSNDEPSPSLEPSAEEDDEIIKLRAKHAQSLSRQHDKHQRELARLAEKQAASARKAADRERKTAERAARADLRLELDRVRAERDVARKEVAMLKDLVGALQAENTGLVARLGRERGDGVSDKGLERLDGE